MDESPFLIQSHFRTLNLPPEKWQFFQFFFFGGGGEVAIPNLNLMFFFFSEGFSLSRYVKIPQEKDLYPPGSAAYMRSEQYVVTLGSSSGQGSAFSEAK